jgi:hypothetical protein
MSDALVTKVRIRAEWTEEGCKGDTPDAVLGCSNSDSSKY